jgi:transcriptional regulator with XRE-family HTH domain
VATPGEVQLALRLRDLRERARITQQDLAVLFSREQKVGPAAISAWENVRRPSSLPESRVEPYARLFSKPSSPLELVPEGELTDDHKQRRATLLEELRTLVDQARGASSALVAARAATYRSWFFDDDGPAVIIAPDAPEEARGPLSDESDPNYTALHRFADLDALIELHGHIKAENEPGFPVFFRLASEATADDLSSHVVLLGGIGWNRATDRLLRELRRVPVRQMTIPELDTGEIFAVGQGKAERRFMPKFAESPEDASGELEEDVALLARVRNPFNYNRTLTICNGVHSRGVLGAVRALTDARVREANEVHLANRFPEGEFAVLLRVPVFQGAALSPDLENPDNILYAWPSRNEATETTKKDKS